MEKHPHTSSLDATKHFPSIGYLRCCFASYLTFTKMMHLRTTVPSLWYYNSSMNILTILRGKKILFYLAQLRHAIVQQMYVTLNGDTDR